LTLAGKVAAGVPAEEIVAKELSLGGVQRPLDPRELGPGFIEWFRFGDFAGWLAER
jgi:tRNA (cmo5U34)-methyltransferase